MKLLKFWIDCTLHSYSQIFFSKNKPLAVLIILVTFMSPFMGVCALFSVIFTNLHAYFLGFNKNMVHEGTYGFNAILLGLALAHEYQPNVIFVLILAVAMVLLLFISVALERFLQPYQLPFLAIPFVVCYWIVYLSISNFPSLVLSEDTVFVANFIAKSSTSYWYVFAHSLDQIAFFPDIITVYFKTLATIFFQDSILGGISIALGLLYFSRIAFSLSVLSFLSGYAWIWAFGLDISLMETHLIGSNFIFMALAVGCFFLMPNKWSYLVVFLLIPMVLFFWIFLAKILFIFQLRAFSLSFSLTTALFLLFINGRSQLRFLLPINVQYYFPEKSVYKTVVDTARFKNIHLAKMQLPFWGEWFVSQGYNGKITHLGDWSKALDFVIVDQENKTYYQDGTQREHFYCYQKPILAPDNGYVYDIVNTIDENEIGGVDTQKNWGNTIILNHVNGLFTQISHIQKDSFRVRIGDYVTKGTILAMCGNSGRSPEPHIHFQIQLTPFVGAKTFPYPIACFVENQNGEKNLKMYEVPQENTLISNVETCDLLQNAYYLPPAKILRFRNAKDENDRLEWKVYTDDLNRTYLYCAKTNSTLWFANDGLMFYAYDFEGDTDSVLFYFYLANYRILLGRSEPIVVKDQYPLIYFSNPVFRFFQDFVSPFYLFSSAEYVSKITSCDNPNNPQKIQIKSWANAKFLEKTTKEMRFEMTIFEDQIRIFDVIIHGNHHTYICE